MSDEPAPHRLAARIALAFSVPIDSARRVLASALVSCAVLGCLLIARLGTVWARSGAALVLVSCLVAATLWLRRAARRSSDRKSGLAQALMGIDADLRGRVLRAYQLWSNSRSDAQPVHSSELTELHARRMLDTVDMEEVQRTARLGRTSRMRVALLLLVGVAVSLFVFTLTFLEGVDVLLARKGVGPFPLAYVEEIEILAEWPSYLDGTGRRRRLHGELSGVPRGSEIEVRVTPVVNNRKLLLTDGKTSVPLVSDGQGQLVARWVADDPAGLKVAARFGEVLLYDVHQTRVQPHSDRAPVVNLAEAPKTLSLSDVERLQLAFFAHDDHGLSQVDLVVRSGQRTDRSELVRLDGQTRMYRGGTALTREHELLRRPFLPVHISIEARDGNTATGPTWGRSQEIILLPEPLGQAVAQRHIALRFFRKSVSAYVSQEHEAGYKSRAERADMLDQAGARLLASYKELEFALRTDPAFPTRSLSFLAAQVEALGRRGDRRAEPASVLLAVDALIHGLGQREASQLAKDLGQSVEEIAVQARQLHFDPTSLSIDGLLDLLSGNQAGAKQLREVGVLGLDLGSVAIADLGRIERSIKERAFDRAEAGALHLAERLKRATPSFSSTGAGAGVESGTPSAGRGGSPQAGQGQPASNAPSEFDNLTERLSELAREGASELSELERLLDEAQEALRQDFETSPDLDEALSELKSALSELPQVGRGSGSASSEAASARSQGESMIEALERQELREAIERGRDAEQALQRAETLLDRGFGFMDADSLKRARDAVSRAVDEANRALEQQESAAARIDPQGARERAARQRDLSQRAREIHEQGQNPDSALPSENLAHLDQAARLLDQAARALEGGEAEQSRNLAEEAQGHIERASLELQERNTSDGDAGSADGGNMDFEGEVPDQDKDRARDFRERIERGLGRGSGRLAPAVRRYAEDLK